MSASLFRRGMRIALLALGALGAAMTGAAAQSPPSFQQYPLRERILGPGGAVFPDYVTPSERNHFGWVTTTRGLPKGALFAASTVDMNCQQSQVPLITVLSAPPKAKLDVGYGSFLATDVDGGSNYCLGWTVRGVMLRAKSGVRPGDSVRIRVTWPTLGTWYVHDLPVTRL